MSTPNARLCSFCSSAIRPNTYPNIAYNQDRLREAAAHLAGYCQPGCQLAHAAVKLYQGEAWWMDGPCRVCDDKGWVHDDAPDNYLGLKVCQCWKRRGAAMSPEALFIAHAAVCNCREVFCPCCAGDGVVSTDACSQANEHFTVERACPLCAKGVIQ